MGLLCSGDLPQETARNLQKFEASLFRELCKLLRPGQNLAFSPFSISQALSLALAGARGDSEFQMREVLNCCSLLEPGMSSHSGNRLLLNKISGGAENNFLSANRLFGQSGYAFQQQFLDIYSKYYSAPLVSLNFRENADSARYAINSWVEEKTRGHIRNLLPENSLSSRTRLVLANAAYFKADWLHKFDAAATYPRSFWVGGQQEVSVPTMTGSFKAPYAETSGLKALELDYFDREFSMVFLLPNERSGIGDLISNLTPAFVQRVLDGLALSKEKVDVFLPRFKIQQHFGLKSILSDLGMPDVFNPLKADFSGIEPKRELYLDEVHHQAYVLVDEVGTEAAAATAAVCRRKCAALRPTPTFKADHPFVFLIRHKSSGAWVFMGCVTNPESR